MSSRVRLQGTRIVAHVITEGPLPPGEWFDAGNWPGFASRPAPGWQAHLVDGIVQWQDESASPERLDRARNDRWEAIKAAREEFIDTNLPTPYGPFDCKPKDRQNITDAVLLLQTLAGLGQAGATITFTTADNTTVTLNLAQMTEVALLLGQRVQTAYAIGRAKREAITNASTVAAVNAVTWE